QHDDGRSQDEHGLVRERRNPVFFHEDLDAVRHHLKQSKRTDAIGAVPVLPQGEQPSLEPDESGRGGERDDENPEDRQHGIWAGHVVLTIFPQTGNDGSAKGAAPAGRQATPGGTSRRIRTGTRMVPLPQHTSTSSPSRK